jgi:hypothetical protein
MENGVARHFALIISFCIVLPIYVRHSFEINSLKLFVLNLLKSGAIAQLEGGVFHMTVLLACLGSVKKTCQIHPQLTSLVREGEGLSDLL